MRYRPFGRTDLHVSEVGFGCARLGGIFGNQTRAEMLRTLHAALDQGITLYDTADMYTQGESESLLGEAFAARRAQVVIASKVGYCTPSQRQWVARVKPLVRPLLRRLRLKRQMLPATVRGTLTQDFSATYITRAVEGSLKRLGTEYLDLYQLHSPPAWVIQQGEALDALERLQRQGKVRYYGVSCETTEDAELCLRQPGARGIAALQVRLSVLDQGVLTTVAPRAEAQGVALIARECLAGGLLARPHADVRREDLGEDDATRDQRQALLRRYQQQAEAEGRPLAGVALRWVLTAPRVSVMLVGMRTEQHLTDTLTLVQ